MKETWKEWALAFLLAWVVPWVATSLLLPTEEPKAPIETTAAAEPVEISVIHGDAMVTMALEEYLVGVLLGELPDDFSLEVIQYLSTKGRLSVDAQGYLREVRGEKVYAVDWQDKLDALKYIDILKVNEHEMEVLTGYNVPELAALRLAEWGVKEVLITLGSLGSLIYAENKFHHVPAYPPKEVVDATGCGDTYMAGYLYMRNKGASYQEAGCFAAAMSTLKLEHSGPFCGTEEDVLNIISSNPSSHSAE